MPIYNVVTSGEAVDLSDYFWRAPYNPPVSAATFVVHVAQLEQELNGSIRPQDLVEYARSPANELHDIFEWDDAIAGERYRIIEARGYMGAVKVRIPADDFLQREATTIRAMVNVGTGLNQGYVTVKRITEEDVEREIYLDSFRDARHVVEKYQNIAHARSFVTAAQVYLQTHEDDAKEAGVSLETPYQLPKAADLIARRRPAS